MIQLGLLILFMVWAYRRGKRLERKIAQAKAQERYDHKILRQALLQQMKNEWEVQRLEKKLKDVIQQQEKDILNAMRSASKKDQVAYLQQVYGDEEEGD